jgi:cytochrome P450
MHAGFKNQQRRRKTPCDFFSRSLTGNVNPRIPLLNGDKFPILAACFKAKGLAGVLEQFAETAKQHAATIDKKQDKTTKMHTGIVQASLLGNYTVHVSDPFLVKQFRFNLKKFTDGETGASVQGEFLGENTPVTLSADNKNYKAVRHNLIMNLYNPVRALTIEMLDVLHGFRDEIKANFILKRETDLQDFTARIALTMICRTQLGIHTFPIHYQRELISIVSDIVKELVNPINIGLISAKNTLKEIFIERLPKRARTTLDAIDEKLKQKIGVGFTFTPRLAKKVVRAETIIKELLVHPENAPHALKKLNALTSVPKNLRTNASSNSTTLFTDQEVKEIEITEHADLTKTRSVELAKLIIAGGFETTAKSAAAMLNYILDPANKPFVDAMRRNFAEGARKLGKPPTEWTAEDFDLLLNEEVVEDKTLNDEAVKDDQLKHESAKEKLNNKPVKRRTLQDVINFIMESLRLSPAFPNMRMKTTEDFYLLPACAFTKEEKASLTEQQYAAKVAAADPADLIHIPKEAIVIMATEGLHHDADAYGEHPEKFNPPRWEGKETNLHIVGRYGEIHNFGKIGPRNCPGRQFSLRELILLATLLYDHTLEQGAEFKPPQFIQGFTSEMAPGTRFSAMFRPFMPAQDVSSTSPFCKGLGINAR